jgi:hypothetical protein
MSAEGLLRTMTPEPGTLEVAERVAGIRDRAKALADRVQRMERKLADMGPPPAAPENGGPQAIKSRKA